MPSYVVEYSFEQRCFHVDTVAQMYKNNLVMFAEGRRSQFMPIVEARTYVEAKIFCKGFQHAIDQNGVPGHYGSNLDMPVVMAKVVEECELALKANAYPGGTGEDNSLSADDRESLLKLQRCAKSVLGKE